MGREGEGVRRDPGAQPAPRGPRGGHGAGPGPRGRESERSWTLLPPAVGQAAQTDTEELLKGCEGAEE